MEYKQNEDLSPTRIMNLTRQKSLSECCTKKRDSGQSLIEPVNQNFKSAEMIGSGAEKVLVNSGQKKESNEAQKP